MINPGSILGDLEAICSVTVRWYHPLGHLISMNRPNVCRGPMCIYPHTQTKSHSPFLDSALVSIRPAHVHRRLPYINPGHWSNSVVSTLNGSGFPVLQAGVFPSLSGNIRDSTWILLHAKHALYQGSTAFPHYTLMWNSWQAG